MDLKSRRFTYFSPSVKKMRGYTPEEAMALPLDKMMTAESLNQVMEDMTALLEREGSSGFDHDHARIIEAEEFCKDGSTIFVEARLKLLRDGSGKPVEIIGSSRDITERKKAADSLQASESRYRTLFDCSPDGILIASLETRTFRYANSAMCQMLGYTSEEMKSMSVADIHPRDKLPMIVSMFQEIYKGERNSAFNVPCLRKDGNVFNVDIKGTVVVIDGTMCGVAFFRDITDREKVEATLYSTQASLEARVNQSNEISKALINDIGIERAAGIIYESGWRIGLEAARPSRKAWKGDSKSFAEDFFERQSSVMSFHVRLLHFEANSTVARARLCPMDNAKHEGTAADAEMAYAHGFIAAVLSVSFGKPVGVKGGEAATHGNLTSCYEIETRKLEPYEVEAYRLA
ncbi:MAG: PAS domain-containing protein [Methanobacteriota archaeon]